LPPCSGSVAAVATHVGKCPGSANGDCRAAAGASAGPTQKVASMRPATATGKLRSWSVMASAAQSGEVMGHGHQIRGDCLKASFIKTIRTNRRAIRTAAHGGPLHRIENRATPRRTAAMTNTEIQNTLHNVRFNAFSARSGVQLLRILARTLATLTLPPRAGRAMRDPAVSHKRRTAARIPTGL
jgi:hypothetical protein